MTESLGRKSLRSVNQLDKRFRSGLEYDLPKVIQQIKLRVGPYVF